MRLRRFGIKYIYDRCIRQPLIEYPSRDRVYGRRWLAIVGYRQEAMLAFR
jgi:hypothetical protein